MRCARWFAVRHPFERVGTFAGDDVEAETEGEGERRAEEQRRSDGSATHRRDRPAGIEGS